MHFLILSLILPSRSSACLLPGPLQCFFSWKCSRSSPSWAYLATRSPCECHFLLEAFPNALDQVPYCCTVTTSLAFPLSFQEEGQGHYLLSRWHFSNAALSQSCCKGFIPSVLFLEDLGLVSPDKVAPITCLCLEIMVHSLGTDSQAHPTPVLLSSPREQMGACIFTKLPW
jgi:hypothetical protein